MRKDSVKVHEIELSKENRCRDVHKNVHNFIPFFYYCFSYCIIRIVVV
jgi:hypothetical protein